MSKTTSTFRGEEVPVTKDLKEFVRSVSGRDRPVGLLIRMEDFVGAYGELLHNGKDTFKISSSNGPCYVICHGCEVELDERTVASLGKNSVMSQFGMPPVLKCPACGHPDAVIVALS